MKTLKKTYLSICCLLLLIMQQVYAQPGTNDTSFNVADNFSGFDGIVKTTLIQPDGKIIVAGYFKLFNGTKVEKIARLNVDGTLDKSFNSGASSSISGDVYSMALQSDGKIVVGGNYLRFKNNEPDGIVRLNSDGSLDESFKTGYGVYTGTVNSIAIQPDGKIILVGSFSIYDLNDSKNIVRINLDGSIDKTFKVGFGLSASEVNSVVLQSDGKILVGGLFSSYNGTPSNKLVRINTDGSVDESFKINFEYNNNVFRLALQSDGKILVGGSFTKVNNNSVNGFIRLNTNGSLDENFKTTPSSNLNYNEVKSIVIQNDGKIVYSSYLNNANLRSHEIIRVNPDGIVDSWLNLNSSFDSFITSISIQSNGKIIVGGWFTSFNGTTVNKIARINLDGTIDKSFKTSLGFDGGVNSVAVQSNSKIIVAGGFTSFNGVSTNRIAQLNSEGTLDDSFKIGLGFDDYVNSIVVQSDNKIIVGGQFQSYNGKTTNSITRLNPDGSLDESFKIGTGFNSSVSSIIVQTDGKLVVGGSFTSFNGVSANKIVRLNIDGTIDQSFNTGTGFDSSVSSIAIQSDGKIIVAGIITAYNGKSIFRIARLNSNGTIDETFNTNNGFNDNIYSIALQSDGKIIVAGFFSSFNGKSINRLARLNSDGTLDNTFKAILSRYSAINKVVIQSDDKIFIGGTGTIQIYDKNRNGIARLNSDGSLDESFIMGSGFNGYPVVNSIAFQPDGKIIVGGGFNNYDGIPRNKIARLNGDSNLSIDENEISTSANSIYPNPSNGIFNVKTDVIGKNYYITDAVGRIISTGIIIENNTQLNLQNQPNGLYFVKLDNETFKIIKD